MTPREGFNPRHRFFHQARSSEARFRASPTRFIFRPWTPPTPLLLLLPLYVSTSPSRLSLSRSGVSRLLVSGITERGFRYIPSPEGAWFRSLTREPRRSDRAEAKQRPPRYLPSGINQLNARLLEASPSLKAHIPLLRLPILFPPADVFEGRPRRPIRPISADY